MRIAGEHRTDTYEDKDVRENALRGIVKEMDISGLTTTNAKKQNKNIRKMYKKEHSLVSK